MTRAWIGLMRSNEELISIAFAPRPVKPDDRLTPREQTQLNAGVLKEYGGVYDDPATAHAAADMAKQTLAVQWVRPPAVLSYTYSHLVGGSVYSWYGLGKPE